MNDPWMSRMIEIPQYHLHEEVRVTPARTALVVVDMQNDFVRPGGSLCVPDAEATIPAIGTLLDLARTHGMRVVYSQDTHRDGDPEWQIWPEHAREGSWGWQIVDALAPAENETVLRKVRYDAFYGTPLDHPRLGRRHAGDLRHGGQHLRALHGRQRRASLVRRGDPARRDLRAGPVRP
jgi:isochorismate hydrolase